MPTGFLLLTIFTNLAKFQTDFEHGGCWKAKKLPSSGISRNPFQVDWNTVWFSHSRVNDTISWIISINLYSVVHQAMETWILHQQCWVYNSSKGQAAVFFQFLFFSFPDHRFYHMLHNDTSSGLNYFSHFLTTLAFCACSNHFNKRLALRSSIQSLDLNFFYFSFTFTILLFVISPTPGLTLMQSTRRSVDFFRSCLESLLTSLSLSRQ